MSIYRLSPGLISKIAAGEIVDRPASVVKELVENSLDAGANRVGIEVKKAGRVSILIKDDGSGMSREDALLAFERHTTSKLAGEEALKEISTFGFRGEALPSIASVARVTARTRSRESDVGTEIKVEGGEVKEAKPAATSAGTQIEVRELFFNTPARRKFLRSDAREKAAIEGVVSRFLLAFPRVSFDLRQDSRRKSFPPSTLRERFNQLFGEKNVVELQQNREFNIRGLVSSPGSSRASRESQYFFVNRRFVRSSLLTRALYEAYHTLLPRHRHPAAVLFLEAPGQEVDVNVHPTKIEVKFTRAEKVYNFVVGSLRDALLQGAETKRVSSQPLESFASMRDETPPTPQVKEAGGEYSPEVKAGEDYLAGIEPLAQIFNSYILAEHTDYLVLVDQHAAHERVLYEEFVEKYSQGSLEKQKLLKPEVIHLAPKEKASIFGHRELLDGMGFEIEDFGGVSVALRAAPLFLGRIESFEEVVAQIAEAGRLRNKNKAREEIIYRVACSNAVKAGDLLLPEELKAITEKLARAKNPYTCPHGRPTYTLIGKREIEKRFRR